MKILNQALVFVAVFFATILSFNATASSSCSCTNQQGLQCYDYNQPYCICNSCNSSGGCDGVSCVSYNPDQCVCDSTQFRSCYLDGFQDCACSSCASGGGCDGVTCTNSLDAQSKKKILQLKHKH